MSVGNKQNHVGFFRRFERTFYAQTFHNVVGFPEPRRVDKIEFNVAVNITFVQGVARGAFYVGDNGSVVTDKGVKERRFTDVCPADNRHVDAVFNHTSARNAVKHGVHAAKNLAERNAYLFVGDVFQVFFGIVQRHFNLREQIGEFILQGGYLAVQPARQHFIAVFHGGDGLGVNHVHDTFDVGQVHLSVEIGAFREFAAHGKAAAALDAVFKHAVGYGVTAVQLKLNHVLAGI